MVVEEDGVEMDRIDKVSSLTELPSVTTLGSEGQLTEINMPKNISPDDEILNTVDPNQNGKSSDKKGSDKPSTKMVKIKKKVGIMIVVAFFCILFGATCGVLWPSLFDGIMKDELVLSNVSTSYKMWKETPVPMYLKIYLYNWTNYNEAIKNSSVKPHFDQLGPYVFWETDYKVNKVWNNKNGTVTFQQRRVWNFEPTMSVGSLTDKVTNLNPVAGTIAYSLRFKKKLLKIFLTELLKRTESITITKSVQEILFDGYNDELLVLAVDLGWTKLPYKKFAWFYARNASDTYDGTFNMMTGSDNIDNIGIIKEWNFNDVSPNYSKTCGKITGTNGDLWPPLIHNKTAAVFSPDVCTALTLKEAGESDWLGLTGKKFISDEDFLDNGTRVESRKCYCEGVDCQPSGTLNVSLCKFGAPAFVSLPHFYLADESYRQNISGMNPNKKDHEFSLLVQPDTGIPMQVRAALQINFLVQHDDNFPYFQNLTDMYVPMLWFTQEVNLTSEYASQVKLLVILPPLGTGLSFSILGIGVLLVVISLFLYVRQRLEDNETENLLPKDRQNREKDVEETVHNEE